MAAFQIPGPFFNLPLHAAPVKAQCRTSIPGFIEDGTHCRTASPLPGHVDDHPVPQHLVKTAKVSAFAKAWDPDPKGLLDDPRLNPTFATIAKSAVDYAVKVLGLFPGVHETYRDPKESQRRHELAAKGKGSKAADAWHSLHNFGLAMDIWMYDNTGRWVEAPPKHKHHRKFYSDFNISAKRFGLIWGEPIDDSNHFEYHPNWSGFSVNTVTRNHEEALKQARKDGIEPDDLNWLAYFWKLAGA